MSVGTVVSTMESPRTATQVVEMIENRLGFDLYDEARRTGEPIWKIRAREAGKINRALKRAPRRGQPAVTMESLVLAVDYAARHRVSVKTPYGVVYLIEKAQAEARECASQTPVVSALEERYHRAIVTEELRDDFESLRWLGRLNRAVGPAREEVITEWEAERLR